VLREEDLAQVNALLQSF